MNSRETLDKKLLYIANWKSYFTYNQSIAWLKSHSDELSKLAQHNDIIMCPDFLTLTALHARNSDVKLGAQNCSAYQPGAYTGEISAQSLNELGVAYCIVGHSERRQLFHETLDESARKINMLLMYSITPIICVSDNYKVELSSILPHLHPTKTTHLIIAYEPISAIGTGIIPQPERIETVLAEIKQEIIKFSPNLLFSLIYGGSVSFSVACEFKKIPLLDGFLIGKASTDFQELKKIVEC